MPVQVCVCEKEGEPSIFALPFYPFSLVSGVRRLPAFAFAFFLLVVSPAAFVLQKTKKTFWRLILRFVLPALFCFVVALVVLLALLLLLCCCQPAFYAGG